MTFPGTRSVSAIATTENRESRTRFSRSDNARARLHRESIKRLVADEAGSGPGQWVGIIDRPGYPNLLGSEEHSPFNQTTFRYVFKTRAEKPDQAIFFRAAR